MNRHHIQLHHHPSTRELCRGSLLFVHGAYTDSRYWGLNFVPFFQHQGFDCFAVDLSGHGARAGGERLGEFGFDNFLGEWCRNVVTFCQHQGFEGFAVVRSGHGASAGGERLGEFGLDDYVEDIAHAVGLIGQPVTLIGHSMGALVVQRYLERGSAAGAVLPAPVPPTGTAASAAQLLFRYPDYLAALEATVAGDYSETNNDLPAKIYFAPDAAGDRKSTRLNSSH